MVVLLFKVLGRKWTLRVVLAFLAVAMVAGFVRG